MTLLERPERVYRAAVALVAALSLLVAYSCLRRSSAALDTFARYRLRRVRAERSEW